MIKVKFFITICFLLFLFKTNEAILSSLSNAELDKIVDYLKSNEQICIEVIGHTDDVGSENKNQVLSEKRAEAVKAYFISKDIDKKRIKYDGCGETKPIATNNTSEVRHQNKRVECILKNQN
jgi:outer membrane protein OmpA-like peptidoglycan-associated protein